MGLFVQTLFLIFFFIFSPLLAAPPISSLTERLYDSHALNKRYTPVCYRDFHDQYDVLPATPSDCTKAIRQIICGNNAFQMLRFSRGGGPGIIKLPQLWLHGSCNVIIDTVLDDNRIVVSSSLGAIASLALSIVLQCVIGPEYGLPGGYLAAGEGNLLLVSVSGRMASVSNTPANQCLAT